MSPKLPGHTLHGFYAGKNFCGDGLTRGCGGVEDKNKPHCLRWCPQCKALFEWSSPTGWTRRECAVCQHRDGIPRAYEKLAQIMSRLGTYKDFAGCKMIPWSEYQCELLLAEVTVEQFLSGDLTALRQFWDYLAKEFKKVHPAQESATPLEAA